MVRSSASTLSTIQAMRTKLVNIRDTAVMNAFMIGDTKLCYEKNFLFIAISRDETGTTWNHVPDELIYMAVTRSSALFMISCARAQSELSLAEPCDPQSCQLPSCRCSTTTIPGGLEPRHTPQFVVLTFDDGVNVINTETYRSVLYGRTNSDGCPAGATFYINHEYTNYQLVNELYNNGFEIALHSISHQTPQTYWAEATYDDIKKEIADQKIQMSHFANIPLDEIKGVRMPFLQMAGNNSFHVMADYDLEYDSSWVTTSFVEPGLWPYTLDYESTQDCVVPPCPTASIPGPWVMPMKSWFDLSGLPCAMADACFSPPPVTDEQAWFNFIVTNFERQYLGNRAPFGFYLHEWYLAINPAVRNAYIRFLNMINSMEDVFMVNAAQVLEWIKNPIPINEYRQQPCRSFTQTTCASRSCPVVAEHNGMTYWMTVCNLCPVRYPWLGNPLGQAVRRTRSKRSHGGLDADFTMKIYILIASVLSAALCARAQSELSLAESCDSEACQLPSCRCSSTAIPGGLDARDTPQFVVVTFDDAINILNTETYRSILYGRHNSDGCPAGATFYANHEYTNYQLVNELYNNGFEIALHSISHQTPQTYWAEATYEDMRREFADQKIQMSHFANIPQSELKGVRMPFLQLAGNNSFHVMADYDLEYDSTWVTTSFVEPGLWPYTLHYQSTQDCVTLPCPTASIPGPWVMPMKSWFDLSGLPCAMADACFNPPPTTDEQAWFNFIVTNFERQYLGNRAPFGFYLHEWFLAINPAVRNAYVRFLNMINSMEDVFMVNAAQVLEWVKDPIPINEYKQRPCRSFARTTCIVRSCPVLADHNGMTYWMSVCSDQCPVRYPWLAPPRKPALRISFTVASQYEFLRRIGKIMDSFSMFRFIAVRVLQVAAGVQLRRMHQFRCIRLHLKRKSGQRKDCDMRVYVLLASALFVVLGAGAQSELTLAEPCDAAACQLPSCRCSGTSIPGGLDATSTPQFVLMTFDDAINILNTETYRRVLYARQNSNGCPAGATFYANHEYTNYQLVNELYNNGFEIALHSISHQTPQTYWAEATYEDMRREFADQKIQMSHFANIPQSELKGIRKPFLQLSGNNTFHVMADYDIQYDCSWPTISFTNPGLWPYTLDYASTQDCVIPPCPTASIPGPWVIPMLSWFDLDERPCSMADACFRPPSTTDEEAWFNFIVTNFERQYLGNRAPFGFYIHEWFLAINPAVERAYVRFLNMINSMQDVFMVNTAEVIEWVKNPITVSEYRQKPCRNFQRTTCPARSCPVTADHNGMTYWMTVCSDQCPVRYPWLGNPLGL
ncbi:hypothetical protein EVAR_60241_1 [Eumeta japonica]|uniref:NodB homology domain-containing protein n=1 Tax=Eumeta variegata TaxID=151549 RepID=A0A4C1ZSG4_EUMVA|nr:hypothetical protein EVAR_60241_1 [Eumeta japonica]